MPGASRTGGYNVNLPPHHETRLDRHRMLAARPYWVGLWHGGVGGATWTPGFPPHSPLYLIYMQGRGEGGGGAKGRNCFAYYLCGGGVGWDGQWVFILSNKTPRVGAFPFQLVVGLLSLWPRHLSPPQLRRGSRPGRAGVGTLDAWFLSQPSEVWGVGSEGLGAQMLGLSQLGPRDPRGPGAFDWDLDPAWSWGPEQLEGCVSGAQVPLSLPGSLLLQNTPGYLRSLWAASARGGHWSSCLAGPSQLCKDVIN